MRNKLPWKQICIVLAAVLCAAAIVIIGYRTSTGTARMEKYAQMHIEDTYTAEVTLKDRYEEDRITYFIFITDDERKIEFTAGCWFDELQTPFGAVKLSGRLYCADNLEDCVNVWIQENEDVSADFTGYSTEGMLEWFHDKAADFSLILAEYNISDAPEFTAEITYNGYTYGIDYYGQTDDELKEIFAELTGGSSYSENQLI